MSSQPNRFIVIGDRHDGDLILIREQIKAEGIQLDNRVGASDTFVRRYRKIQWMVSAAVNVALRTGDTDDITAVY